MNDVAVAGASQHHFPNGIQIWLHISRQLSLCFARGGTNRHISRRQPRHSSRRASTKSNSVGFASRQYCEELETKNFCTYEVYDTPSKCAEIYVEIGNIVAMMILRDGDGWMSIERVVRGKIESCGGDISATGKKEGLPRRGWRGDTDKG